MARINAVKGGLQRFLNKKSATAKKYVSPRQRAKKKGNSLTSLQRVQLKIERQQRAKALSSAIEDARDDVWTAAKKMHADTQSHSPEYFYRLILQSTRVKIRRRKTSRWNAFLSQELRRRNAEVKDGTDRLRVSDGEVTRAIAEQWHKMSKAEQHEATEDAMKELLVREEGHRTGTHTVPIQAFHDARATMANIQQELEDLHARTGTEVLLFAVRSDTTSYNQPFAFVTSTRLSEFVKFTTQNTPSQYALKLEGYCVSGMQGIAHNYVQSLINLKKDAAVLINNKLQEVSTRGPVGRMCYLNFAERITSRHGIVIENWPLRRFCAPGEISSRPELETLIGAWTNNAARFRALTDAEWDEWKVKQSGGGGGLAEGGDDSTAGGDGDGDGAAGGGDDDASGGGAVVTTETISPTQTPAHDTSAAATTPAQTGAPAAAVAAAANGPARKRSRAEVNFITVDVVTGADGRSVAVGKRQRQPRKSKASAATTVATTSQQANVASGSGDITTARKGGSRKKSKKDKQAVAPVVAE